MKIYILILLLVVVSINQTFGQDPFEPNDTYQTAATVTCGQQFSAYIQTSGDFDWYEIELSESGVLEVAITSVPDNLDLNVEIYQIIENALTLIADDRTGNSTPGQDIYSNAVVNAGNYLILIEDEGNTGFSDSDPYDVALSCTPNSLELNQVYEEASLIPADTCFEANIYGDNHLYTVYNDVDWFKVQVLNSGVLEVAVTSVPDNLDLNVEIYQIIENALTLISDDRLGNSTPGQNIFANAVINPGTYLISVNDEGNSGFNEDNYTFCVNFTANSLELNQVYEQAAPIPADTCFEANIYGDNHLYTVYNDVDWFEVQVLNSGVLEVAVTSVPDNLDLNLEIYQIIENALTLISDDRLGNSTPGQNISANAVINPGTYLISVNDEGNSGFNEDYYTFCVNFTANALELNQVYEEAAPIPADTCFEANIYGDNHLYTVYNDVDWFKVQVEANISKLEVAVTSVPDNLDLNVEIYQIIENVLTLIADDGVGNAVPGEDMFASADVSEGTYLIVVEDEGNNAYNEETYTFCADFVLDIQEQSLSSQLEVSPNPNNGQFSINLLLGNNMMKILKINIYDYLGREISEFQPNDSGSNEVFMNINNASRGLYVIRILTNSGIVTKKIMVN